MLETTLLQGKCQFSETWYVVVTVSRVYKQCFTSRRKRLWRRVWGEPSPTWRLGAEWCSARAMGPGWNIKAAAAFSGSSSSHTPLVGEAQPRGQEVPGQSARRFQRRKAHATPGLLGPCVCNPVCSNCLPLRESFPRQVDKKSRGPQGERGLEFSKRKQDKLSFFLCIL